jgi:glycine cleavage system regulatory protein
VGTLCFTARLIAHTNSLFPPFYSASSCRPGLLATISESLADKGLSIESIVTDVQVGKNNRHEFVVNADCIATSYMDHDTLSAMVTELGSLKQELDLNTFDVRVQRLVENNND